MKSKNKQTNHNNKNTQRNYQRSEEAKETGQLKKLGVFDWIPKQNRTSVEKTGDF